MSVFTITFDPSEEETVSGIPNTVAVETSDPATIYYTLDGTLPTLFTTVYTDPIKLPTNQNSVSLSVIAYYLDGYGNLVPSAVLSNIYSTDWSEFAESSRFLHFEGVVYSYPGGLDIPFYYDASGEVLFSIDIPEDDLFSSDVEFLESDQDVDGNVLITEQDVGPASPDTMASSVGRSRARFSTPNSEIFDPEAYVIQIDGRDGAGDQVVQLINGPFMSLRDLKTSYGGVEFYNIQGENYISGDAAKPLVNREKGIIVFNYFDTNSGRFVKSIQKLAPATRPINGPPVVIPMVFHWFLYGRQQMV